MKEKIEKLQNLEVKKKKGKRDDSLWLASHGLFFRGGLRNGAALSDDSGQVLVLEKLPVHRQREPGAPIAQ